MAIKGKGKTKQRPVPRAPRREPVPVPTPFLRRRWVQVTAAFVLGVLATIVMVWVTNGLRAGDDEADAAGGARERAAAATRYQQAVRSAFGTVGVVEPGVTPKVLVEMDAALDALAGGKGEVPADAERIFEQAARDAARARKELAAFDVVAAVRDRGFDPIAVTSFVSSAETLVRALDLYRRAAQLASAAATLDGPAARRVATSAAEIRDMARAELEAGWTEYLQALVAGGVPETPVPAGG